MPFDTYSIMNSCGPQRNICMKFDFRKISHKNKDTKQTERITEENVKAKSDLLWLQYAKAASLFPHNIAIIPLGGDFHYSRAVEIDQQYSNYERLIDYINDHPERYDNTEISFGLPIDYFEEIRVRYQKYPHLKGDFFVYSDIYNEGKPAFWSGYFTTRPMFKMLSRELEHNLRCAEILFTIGLNHARTKHNKHALRFYEKNYKRMISARRNLADFQHHEAITGTSKAQVMKDYGTRISKSIHDTVQLQESTIEMLMENKASADKYHIIVSELKRDSYHRTPKKTPITVHHDTPVEVILFNSLAQQRPELITIHTRSLNLKVFDNNGTEVRSQINPVWEYNNISHNWQMKNLFEVIFVADLPPLALVIYTIKHSGKKATLATIHCNECDQGNNDTNMFEFKPLKSGDIRIKTVKMQLQFDGVTGFLKTITPKSNGKRIQCNVKFGAYDTVPHHSGAYLFKTDGEGEDCEKDILDGYRGSHLVFITSGPMAIDVTVIYGHLLKHTIRIFQTGTSFDHAIHIKNDVNFGASPRNTDTEMYMRFGTSINNTVRSVMYSDQNGFQFHRREKQQNLGIEANYYPITTAAFIQDEKHRLTLLTSHAQGAASLEPGSLEVMLDRRTLCDDDRGMGEGITDSQLTQQHFWLIPEQMQEKTTDHNNKTNNSNTLFTDSNIDYEMLSQFGNQLSNILNYPVNLFYVENQEEVKHIELHEHLPLLKMQFPCDVHLTNLRTQTQRNSTVFPSQRALLVLQRQAASCKVRDIDNLCQNQHGFKANGLDLFHRIELDRAYQTSLTGIYQYSRVTHFDKVFIEPMDIVTFNLTFV